MRLRLKSVLQDMGLSQGALASMVGVSRPALVAIVNHNHWLPSLDRDAVERAITDVVREHGGSTDHLFAEETDATPAAPLAPTCSEDPDMLLRKKALTPEARRHFELTRNPFDEPRCADDVFLSPSIRYVREAMWSTARHGGFLGVVGESGAGKTTLCEELEERLTRESQPTIVVKPYVLGMEDKDTKGKRLTAMHITEAIMRAIAPLAKTASSPQARFAQLHEALKESSRAGHSHVLIIEEAHALAVPTLKHLKRFLELKDGMRPLISVILLGQSELALKLNENDPHVREVVQRIELITLPPLDADLDGYLKLRFERVGVPLARIVDAGAVDALRIRLTPDSQRGTRQAGSLLYPLAVHNVFAEAMNRAAALGLPRVTADAVRGV